MSFERKMFFVLARDGGSEGYSPPVWAFADHADAITALVMAQAMAEGTWRLFEVPLYPSMPRTPWYQLKPLEV